jgi:hypothetical protein
MAIYAWFGGHTGYTGTNSGYTAQYGGPSGSPAWVSGIDGSVSTSGDFVFGPYFWGNPKNWRSVTPIGNTYYYNTTNFTPQGGDTVYIGNKYVVNYNTNSYTSRYGVSLLYGGMSGDGFVASGQTGWFGATGAQNGTTGNPRNRYQDITFYVGMAQGGFYPDAAGAKGYYGWDIRTGEIGQGATSIGLESGLTALNIRTAVMQNNDYATNGYGSGATIVCKNLSTSVGITAPKFYTYSAYTSGTATSPTYSIIALLGNWPYIYQYGSNVLSTQSTISTTGASWYAGSNCTKIISSNTNKTKFFNISCDKLVEDAYIWGNYGGTAQAFTSAVVTVNGYQGADFNHAVTLGSLHEGTQPIFSTVTLGSGTANNSPYIKFGSAKVNALLGNDGNIGVHESAASTDQVIIRDGYLRKGNLLMYHPTNQAWQNFKLGDPTVATDPGIRIDSSAVDVRCFNGQTLVTQAGLQGEYAYPVLVAQEETIRP